MTDMIWQLPKAERKPRRHLGCCSANYDPIVLLSFWEEAFKGLPFSTSMINFPSHISWCVFLSCLSVGSELTKQLFRKLFTYCCSPQIQVRHKLAERYSSSTLCEALHVACLQAADHYWLFNIEFLKEYLVLLILNLNQMESDLFNIPSKALEHHFKLYWKTWLWLMTLVFMPHRALIARLRVTSR